MLQLFGPGVILLLALAAGKLELRGRVHPPLRAAVALDSALTPFTTSTLAGPDGSFRFRNLQPGSYTLRITAPGYGEVRRTVVLSPSLADSKGRIEVKVEFEPSPESVSEEAERRHRVSVQQLRIPERALNQYRDAQKRLERNEVEAAVRHLRRAVEIAPQFSAAWNNLGTIAYHSGDYPQAERYFREALEQEPGAFSPMVNLGGVLLNLRRFTEALPYNVQAVRDRPDDALAQSQLGMNYFFLENDTKAIEHLNTAKRLDPAHFSRPQLILAEIYLRRSDRTRAAQELEDYLARHPDASDVATIRKRIEGLR